MWYYVTKRILATLPVMGVVAVIVFLLLRLSPGDPAAIIAGDDATSEDIAKIREHLGLDRPLLTQFVRWIGQLATGVLAAWRAGTWIDQAIMALSVLAFSVPVFLIGYGLVIGFSLTLELLPVQGFVSLSEDPVAFFRHLVLPTVALGLVYTALIARITRATMLETLNEDFIRTARAKGLGEPRVLILHSLKNASVPIVTTIGTGIALLIGGVVVTESVFAVPGIGRLTIDAVMQRDYPVIQGVILVVAGVYVLVNLLIDLTYSLLDPRIRY
jgi:peptide/nickel transport system permease protein